MARSKWNEAQAQHCRTSTLCDAVGVDLVSDAKSEATVATMGFAAGGALLASGVVLSKLRVRDVPASPKR